MDEKKANFIVKWIAILIILQLVYFLYTYLFPEIAEEGMPLIYTIILTLIVVGFGILILFIVTVIKIVRGAGNLLYIFISLDMICIFALIFSSSDNIVSPFAGHKEPHMIFLRILFILIDIAMLIYLSIYIKMQTKSVDSGKGSE